MFDSLQMCYIKSLKKCMQSIHHCCWRSCETTVDVRYLINYSGWALDGYTFHNDIRWNEIFEKLTYNTRHVGGYIISTVPILCNPPGDVSCKYVVISEKGDASTNSNRIGKIILWTMARDRSAWHIHWWGTNNTINNT